MYSSGMLTRDAQRLAKAMVTQLTPHVVPEGYQPRIYIYKACMWLDKAISEPVCTCKNDQLLPKGAP